VAQIDRTAARARACGSETLNVPGSHERKTRNKKTIREKEKNKKEEEKRRNIKIERRTEKNKN